MANLYFQIRCGTAHKNMTVGMEYNLAVGEPDSKVPPEKLLEILEEAVYDGLKLKFGELYETRGSHAESKPIPPKPIPQKPSIRPESCL